MSNQASIDSLVFDFFLRGAETVVHDRKATIQPMTNISSTLDCTEYIRQTVQSWKRQLSRPMNIDLYIFNNAISSHVLMERWNFVYTYVPESSEIAASGVVGQRLQILLRSLYSFMRLLPGFNLLHCSQAAPLLTVQIYDPKISPEPFRCESSNYSFPLISTSKGTLSMAVAFANPGVVKDILRSISGGSLVGLPSLASARTDRQDGKSNSASIPIPGRTPPVDPYRQRVSSDSKEAQIRRGSLREENALTAALRQEYAQAKSVDSRSIDPNFMPSSVSSSGPSRGILYPGSFGGSGELNSGTSPSPNSGKLTLYPLQSNNHGSTAYSFQASTPPPFTSMPVFDPSFNGTVDMPRPSPPFNQISSSLNSASPHIGPSQLTTLMDRRNSWRKSFNNHMAHTSTSLKPDTLSALEYELSKTRITLPPSPFLALTNAGRISPTGGDTLLAGGPTQSLQTAVGTALGGEGNNRLSEVGDMTKLGMGDFTDHDPNIQLSTAGNNRLDIVTKFEKEKERRNTDLFLYDGYSDSRTVSISETTRDRDDDTVDTALMDEDTPFATHRPSLLSASSLGGGPGLPMAIATSASSAAVAPIIHILNRNTNKPTPGMTFVGSIDNVNNSGIPLPSLTHDLQCVLDDHLHFFQQYTSAKNISVPSSASASLKEGHSHK